MNDSPNALRPEAGPVPFEYLNRTQLRAMKSIVSAINEAVAQAALSDEPSSYDSMIDPNRVSRLFFVSGQPGSGKSSLYLTLRAILSKNAKLNKPYQEYDATIPELVTLRGATVWLEPMNLEVTGDTGENLLAAVLVRIFDALDDSAGLQSKLCQDAMDQLNDLANDIGIAWDGNLLARAPSLDPQSYSQEVMNSQRARLGTNRRLFEALNAPLKNNCYGCQDEKLFILPIDDFYLKPAASLELLRLLRMISVPNLFFLIMGDIKTMEALFFENALADWTAVAGSRVFASLNEQKQDEVLSRVREMRARYLRKLLPTAQRSTIEWSNWDEALRYKPTGAKSSTDSPRLCNLLSDVRIEGMDGIAPSPEDLRDYLIAPPYVPPASVGRDLRSAELDQNDSSQEPNGEPGQARLKKFREAYSALLVLDATPREIVDIWMRFSELKQWKETATEQIPAYLWTVIDLLLLAIEEQDFLTEQQQDALRYAFPASHKDNLFIDTENFELAPKLSPVSPVEHNNVVVYKHLDWKLGIYNNNLNHTRVALRHLPPRTAAWVILIHDLAWSWQQSSLTRNLVNGLRDTFQPIDLSSEHDKRRPLAKDSGWAWYFDEKQWVHFPVEHFNTFRRLDRFLTIWNDGLSNGSNPSSLRTIVNLWSYAAWIVMGPEDRYVKFVMEHSWSEEDKVDLNRSRAKSFLLIRETHPAMRVW